MTGDAARLGRKFARLEQSRPKYMDELDQIIAGQQARIASLQEERVLTPYEIMSMVEALGG